MNRRKEILQNLSEDSYITASALAEILKVSTRTVRNDIAELNRILENHGAAIVSRARYGIRIEIDDLGRYRAFLNRIAQEYVDDPNVRYLQIIEYLLELGQPITMDDLCEIFFISRSTLKIDMKAIKKALKVYDIYLDHRANRGLIIKGSEQNIRRCLTYIQRELFNPYMEINQAKIKKICKIVESCINRYHFEISDYSITNLALHIYISIKRIRSNKMIRISSDVKKKLTPNPDRDLIFKIVSEIEENFNVVFSKDEIYYLLIQISGKKLNGKMNKDKYSNSIVTGSFYQLVSEMLDRIYEVFKIDFKYDLEFITSLSMHMEPLEFRIKHDITVQNSMTEEVRQHVILPFNMASVACEFLERKYGKRLPDDEVTFIALHFYVALERKRSGQKENLLVVCGSGNATSELLIYQIKSKLGNLFNIVGSTSRHALKDYDFSQVDYILSTVSIDMTVPVPIIMTDDFLGNGEVKRIQKTVSEDRLDDVLYYFKKDMIFWSDLEEKNEVIQFLCQKARDHRNMPESFYQDVLKREEIGRTSFGNLISIAHPMTPMGEESFVGMAILKKPIIWDDQKVQIVFLLSMKEKGDKDMQDFYKIMSKLVAHRSFVMMLCKVKTYDEVVDVLRQVAVSES